MKLVYCDWRALSQRLILSYTLIERLITTVVACSVYLAVVATPTYSVHEPVNTATTTADSVATTTETEAVSRTLTNTAGTTEKVAVVGQPRLLAQEGESQEVINAVLNMFPEEPVMVEVARCESRLNPKADRQGIDGGLFQINQVHLTTLNELGLDRYDLQDNLTYSRILYNQGGLTPWNMSRYCWGKYA